MSDGNIPIAVDMWAMILIRSVGPSRERAAHAGATPLRSSGNGRLSPDASNPNSTLETHLLSLEIYMISSALIITVVRDGRAFLNQARLNPAASGIDCCSS